MNKGLEKVLIKADRVSVHGGHSGQFCQHASDKLEEIVQAYITQGFRCAGITEHIPPASDAMRYPDEKQAGLSADFLQERFAEYFRLGRELQQKYREQIELFLAFEIEHYPGSETHVEALIEQYQPDYLVGSLHHVGKTGIDYSHELFQQALQEAGSMTQLYCDYFDAQFDMLQKFKPSVVGHFDLIRIYDQDYLKTLKQDAVQERITRNLDFIAENRLILDFNLRGFDKAMEQYPSLSIIKQALQKNIALVPGDDSHGVSSVGRNYDQGLTVLSNLGATLDWQKPNLMQY